MTLKKAVEEIARGLEGPVELQTVVRDALERTGRTETKSTSQTVRDALGGLSWIVRCGPGLYGPAAAVLDGKAFRVSVSEEDVKAGRFQKRRLQPFYRALGDPPIQNGAGEALPPILLSDTNVPEVREDILQAARNRVREMFPFLPVGLLDKAVADLDFEGMDTGLLELTPLGLETEGGAVDLIVRWDAVLKVLQVSGELRDASNAERMIEEDTLLADFVVSHLTPGYAKSLAPLLLEAYAQLDRLGREPGSDPLEVIRRDERMRITTDDSEFVVDAGVTYADRPTFAEQRREARGKEEKTWMQNWREKVNGRIREHARDLREAKSEVREKLGLAADELAAPGGCDALGLPQSSSKKVERPTNEELITAWDEFLAEDGLSEKVRRRKVNHLETLVHYLRSREDHAGDDEGDQHLFDVDEGTLESFFFWSYVRRFPNSATDAKSFPLDVWEFYRFCQEAGHIRDARFAELIYRLREYVVERIELYECLDAEDPDFDEMFETLFLG